MADTKISALTGATTPLAGTEVVPIVQSSTTKNVSVANLTAGRDITAASLVTTGVITTGPASYAQMNSITGTYNGTFNALALGTYDLTYNARTEIKYITAIGSPAKLSFVSGYSSGWGPTVYQFDSDVISTGNFVIGTSGKGIDFSANSHASGMTSETLTWYEEGVYTATLTPDSGTVTLDFNKLKYTRIGRQVTVIGFIQVSSVSTPTGYLGLNLPFTPSSGDNYSNRCAGVTAGSNYVSKNGNDMAFTITESTASAYLADISGTTLTGAAAAQQMQATTAMNICITYFV